MVLLPLIVPIFCEPKTRAFGDKTTGDAPVPLRFSDVGYPYALWLTVSVPEAAPKADGEKTTLIEQVKPAAKDIGQLFV
jgi:hypothetical protein